jgi:hypothetical protein
MKRLWSWVVLSCFRGGDWYQLLNRRRRVPIGRWNGLPVPQHHLQAQLCCLARVRLRFFRGFAIRDDPVAALGR